MVAKPATRGLFILLFLLATMLLAPLSAAAQQFVTVDYPGATGTVVFGVNNAGQMVGAYTDSEGLLHGFSLIAGTYTEIDFPNGFSTQATGINNLGQIVGSYVDVSNVVHGFVLTNGVFTSVTDPAFACSTCAAEINDITDTGVMIGAAADANAVIHGIQDFNGTFTTLDVAGATYTALFGIPFLNGDIVGSYSLIGGTDQGLVYSNGQFTTFNVTGASTTDLYGINDSGQVLGSYSLPAGGGHVFLTTCTNQSNGPVCSQTLTNVDFPGALATLPSNLNDGGQVVGGYVDGNNVTHGYLMTGGPFAYVTAGTGVSVVDTTTDVVVTTIPISSGTEELAVTPDQSHVYASGFLNDVLVIDTVTNTVVATVQGVPSPDGVAVTPDGNFAYVANDLSAGTVTVISTATNTIVATIPVGPSPFLPKVTPDGTLVYVSNQNGTLSVIQTSNNTVVATVNAPGPTGLAFTPNGAFAYVGDYTNPGTVTVLAIPSNTVVATVQLGANTVDPIKVAVTPDGTLAYVTNLGSNNVSVIDTASNSVIATVSVGTAPYGIAISPDGSLVYVGNLGDGTVSIISTSTNTVTATIPVGDGSGIAMASSLAASQPITQPLSPTQPNVFNFGTNNQTVQYPPGTNFTNVNMTTTEVQLTQAQFAARVAGTQFASAVCIVYSGAGGNCVDYEVTCTDNNGNPITCPGESGPTITVQTGFDSSQAITNPAYLTTPIGLNEWTNIFTSFTDPIVKGKTTGFSEFVAVDLGATNAEGMAKFKLRAPKLPGAFCNASTIPLEIELTSVANGSPITDAQVSVTAVRIADGKGNPVQQSILSATNAFKQNMPGDYSYTIRSSHYPAGTYTLTIYGNAFPAFQAHFEIQFEPDSRCKGSFGAWGFDTPGLAPKQ